MLTGLVAAGALVIVGGGLFAAGVFEGDGAPATADPAATSTPAASPTPEEIPGKTIGTPDNPFHPGDSFTFFDDWTFTLGKTDTDLWPDVASYYEEHFPDEIAQIRPDPGMVYVSAPLTMTYSGTPSKQDDVAIALHHVTTDGSETRYSSCNLEGREFDRFDSSSVQSEPEVLGSLCVEIPTAQVPGGQWWIYLSHYDPATGIERNEQYFYAAE